MGERATPATPFRALPGFCVARKEGIDFDAVRLATFTFRSLGVKGLAGEDSSISVSSRFRASGCTVLEIVCGSTILSKFWVGRLPIGFDSALLIKFNLDDRGSALTARGTPWEEVGRKRCEDAVRRR